MHEGMCEQEVKSWDHQAEGFDILFTQARVHCDNKPQQIGLDHDYNLTFFVNVSILRLKYKYGAQSESRFACYSYCYVMWCPLNDGNFRLTMPLVKTCARLRYTWDYLKLGICSQITSTAMGKLMLFPAKIHIIMFSQRSLCGQHKLEIICA